jgi:hypothetical protein
MPGVSRIKKTLCLFDTLNFLNSNHIYLQFKLSSLLCGVYKIQGTIAQAIHNNLELVDVTDSLLLGQSNLRASSSPRSPCSSRYTYRLKLKTDLISGTLLGSTKKSQGTTTVCETVAGSL